MVSNMDTAALLVKMSAALVTVLGLMALLVWLLKKGGNFGKSSNRGFITIIDQKVLSPKRSLILVRVGKKYLLLGANENSVSTLATFSNADFPDFDMALKDELSKQEKNGTK